MSSEPDTNPVITSLNYHVEHETRYTYTAPVVYGRHLLHLTPRANEWQTTLSHGIELLPLSGHMLSDQDQFGNLIQRVELDRPHQQLNIVARSQVQVRARPDYAALDSLPWERLRDELSYCGRPRTPKELEATAYRTESPHVRIKNVFAEFAAECFPHGQPMLAGAEALMHKLHEELTYTPGATTVSTSLLAVLETRRGVCQDYSHLMLACLRSLGLSARYVSGYLRTVPPEGGEVLTGADASHAWVSVYAPPFDWVDLDPTNGIRVDMDHLTLGWGRDFSDVSPVRGVIVGGGQHKVAVGVTVQVVNADDMSELP
jgi:transglutaminase-like putative cysteine protease